MIHIKKSKKGEFYIHVVARNRAILSHSEGFKKKSNVWKNIRATAMSFGSVETFEVRDFTIRNEVIIYTCYMMENEFVKVEIGRKISKQ